LSFGYQFVAAPIPFFHLADANLLEVCAQRLTNKLRSVEFRLLCTRSTSLRSGVSITIWMVSILWTLLHTHWRYRPPRNLPKMPTTSSATEPSLF
jgi:hypothetical protein